MFHITCFRYSPNRSSLVLQDQAIKWSGMPGTPNAIQNLKTSLLTECAILCKTVIMHTILFGATTHTTQIWCKLSWHSSQAYSFFASQTSGGMPTCLILQYHTYSFGSHKKQGTGNTPCQYWWLKTENSRPYSNATSCDILSIASAWRYWTTWWSPTKHHIETVMIYLKSNGHGIYLPALIAFLHILLKC